MALELKNASAKSEATAARIVAAAKSLFVARNYADVTTDMIAQAADVTKGGLYHHFASKEQLYTTMMVDDLDHKRRLFSQAVAASGSCRQRLGTLTGDFLKLPHEDQQLIRLVRRDINTFSGKERDRLVRAYQRALPDLIEAIVADGMRDGELATGDTRIVAWSFAAIMEIMLGDYAGRVFGSPDTRLDYVLDLFFHGAAADPTGETQ